MVKTKRVYAGIPQGVICLGILRWLKAALTGSYEQ